ncbi:MAG: YdcF family protein [Planctomycetaceae bacterium]
MYDLVKSLAHPLTALMIAIGFGLFWVSRSRLCSRRPLIWLVVPWSLLWILSLPVTAYFVAGLLEWRYQRQTLVPEDVELIVVLGGGAVPGRGRIPPRLTTATLQRCLHGLRIAKSKPDARILLCGGRPQSDPQAPVEADVMRDVMIEFGLDPQRILCDRRSRTTFENAIQARRIIRRESLSRVVLVTDGRHLYRALRCFQSQGVAVIPSGCRWSAVSLRHNWYSHILPQTSALGRTQDALYEWIGIVWYQITGKI